MIYELVMSGMKGGLSVIVIVMYRCIMIWMNGRICRLSSNVCLMVIISLSVTPLLNTIR